MILNDLQIKHFAEHGMIAPFVDHQVKESSLGKPVISYGLSSFGYDLRLAGELRIFTRTYDRHKMHLALMDPKSFDDDIVQPAKQYITQLDSYFVLDPGDSALGRSVETLHLPDDVFALCVGKSTYARCGLIVNTTPLEPGWRGELVVEIHNTTSQPMKVYANEGIAQLTFFRGDRPLITYGDRNGKYQNQTGITTARV
jgi:dCTP deaminase